MSQESKIRAVIQTYFECMYESNAEKTHAAFHPSAKITGYMGETFVEMTVNQFAHVVAEQQPSARDQGLPPRLDVLSVQIAGSTAVARVRDDFLGNTYLDTLSFVEVDDAWVIYNKLFHIEGPAKD